MITGILNSEVYLVHSKINFNVQVRDQNLGAMPLYS